MKVGVPKEVRINEFRVGLTPEGAKALVQAGHSVFVERGAGANAGFPDAEYAKAGARISHSASVVWGCDLVLKVKEPEPSEYCFFRKDLTLFTFLHLAPHSKLTQALLKKQVTAIAYEMVERNYRRPILEPMSQIAGRMAPLVGAFYQSKPHGGRGVLIMGLPNVRPASVAVLGGGTVGENAARIASSMGGQVTILEKRVERLAYLKEILPESVTALVSTPESIEQALCGADIVIGAVLIPGALAPKLIRRSVLKKMKPGSVIVDVAIDQGGVCETSHPTTHLQPVFTVSGVLHYCVANMPAAYAHTATLALVHSTLPYIQQLADLGTARALSQSPEIAAGVNCYQGQITCQGVATSQQRKYVPLHEILK